MPFVSRLVSRRASLALVAMAIAEFPASGAAQALPRVHILATGGTISNLGNDARRTGDELVSAIPRIRQIARVTVEQFDRIERKLDAVLSLLQGDQGRSGAASVSTPNRPPSTMRWMKPTSNMS